MKGICFIEPMFNAVIEGRKTQTRRIINLPKEAIGFLLQEQNGVHRLFAINEDEIPINPKTGEEWRINPRYNVGEIIYLKEPYIVEDYNSTLKLFYKYSIEDNPYHLYIKLINSKWENKLFMPEKYARYFIEITAVKYERLQDISDKDCISEGIFKTQQADGKNWTHYDWINRNIPVSAWNLTPKDAYAAIIDSVNRKGTWENNPYVWVYEFKLTDKL